MANESSATTPTTSTAMTPAQFQHLADKSFTGTDIVWVLGAVVLCLSLYTMIRKLFQEKRAEDSDSATKRTNLILDKMQENKTAASAEVEGLRGVIRHDFANIETKFVAIEHMIEHQGRRVGDLNDRVVKLEAHREYNNDTMDELKSTIKEINSKLKP